MPRLADGTGFVCDYCNTTYRYDRENWSEDDVQKEMKERWGDLPEDDQAVLCDGCNDLFVVWARAQGLL